MGTFALCETDCDVMPIGIGGDMFMALCHGGSLMIKRKHIIYRAQLLLLGEIPLNSFQSEQQAGVDFH